ncbi:MAG: flagellar filament capping protein FliD [Selenomonadaceae bacterium]|nr:flagellar filament capping protein FliD [Selenomonadaceae bacterium]
MGVNGIYGLSGSGMDIESMVKVGMMSRQNEYDKMAQKFTQNEWLKADYLELNNQITTFNASTLSQYKMSTTMNAKSAETNSTSVKASVNSAAAVMDHKVQVTQVASAAYLVGTNNLTRYNTSTGEAYASTDEGSSSIKLSDVLFQALATNSAGNVYGKIAGTDLDMEGTARDDATRTSADGVAVTGAQEFGYASNAAHWEKDGQYYEPDDDELANTYKLTQQVKDEHGWYYRKIFKTDGSSNGYGWYKYNDDNTWSFYRNPENNSSVAADFKQYIADRAAETGLSRYAEGGKYYTTAESGVDTSATAFSFTLSDGATKNDDGTLKEVTISYTYAQLMGDDGKTFNDLVADINKSGLNIKASYDSVHDLFSFYNSKTGADNTIDIKIGTDTDYTGSHAALATRNFFNNLGLYQSVGGELYYRDSNGALAAADEDEDGDTGDEKNTILFNLDADATDGTNSFAGTNAAFKIDGVTYDNVSGNNITVGGVTYTALEKMDSAATVTITQDTDAIIDKVKSFITDYNKLLASLYEKYEEKPNSDYKPLTQSQKDNMKEEQITKWEEKAKQGLLYHDQTIGKIIQNMRNGIIQSVEGVDGQYNSVFSLGISTTGLKGQLVLDEDKLKKALSEDPDSVYNIFAKLDANDMDNQAKSGIAQRLGDILVDANKSIKDRAGSSADITEDSDLNSLLRNLQTKMSNFKKLMNSFEDALYKKYDAMEATLAKLGTQLNFIMGGNG